MHCDIFKALSVKPRRGVQFFRQPIIRRLIVCTALAAAWLTGCSPSPTSSRQGEEAVGDASPQQELQAAWRDVIAASADAIVYIRTEAPLAHDAARGPTLDALHEPNHAAARWLAGGTGVLISADGLILTSAHVVEHATSIDVRLADGRWYHPQRIAVDPQRDVALLQIAHAGLPHFAPAWQRVGPGTPVAALARLSAEGDVVLSAGLVLKQSAGLAGRLANPGGRDYSDLLETSVALQPGYSGGPLLDYQGRLIGLNVALLEQHGRARGYALRLDESLHPRIAALREQLQREWRIANGELGKRAVPEAVKRFWYAPGALVGEE